MKAWSLLHAKERKIYKKKYRAEHKKEIAVYAKKYHKEWVAKNKEHEKKRKRKWYLKHQKRLLKKRRKYHLSHLEKEKEYFKNFRKTPKGKIANHKHYAIRKRKLGFIALNKPFKNSRGHHVDVERVIYIPRKMHEDNRHSVLQNRNMEKINKLAFEFLDKGQGEG